MDKSDGRSDVLRDLSVLGDAARRRLYKFVTAQSGPVTREQAAAAAGITRTLAAYHLDKLTEAGLVEAGYARPEGRRGPGAGRPAKYYVRADRELSVTVPARNYLLMADLLAQAVAADSGGSARDAAADAAQRTGRAATAEADLDTALDEYGYEPVHTHGGDIELRNCPFHRLSKAHTDLVCGLNLALIKGLLDGVGEAVDRADLAPQDGRCCVVIHAKS